MSEEVRKNYTIRLPERIAAQVEATATEAGTTPTTLIQSLVISRFEAATDSTTEPPPAKRSDSTPRSSMEPCPDSELRQQERHRQLLYEIGKMRSVLLHSLDHTLDADSVDQIIEASEKAASEYVAGLLGVQEGRQ
jgi:hypothetical protein